MGLIILWVLAIIGVVGGGIDVLGGGFRDIPSLIFFLLGALFIVSRVRFVRGMRAAGRSKCSSCGGSGWRETVSGTGTLKCYTCDGSGWT